MKDLAKVMLALVFYGVLGPALGVWLSSRRTWQRAVFALMLIMTALRPGNFMMMINSVESYRGHSKGFEISLIEVLALALIIAVVRQRPSLRAVRPPGLGLYLSWCGLSMLSILGSIEPLYGWMAATRFLKGSLIFAAASLYLRDEKDLRWALGALGAALFHHGLLCLKLRLLDGSWQVKGWFEHQNPMAIWCYLGALPLLAAVLWPGVRGWLMWLFLAGYGGAALCILLSVSRAALAAYAIGSAIVLGLAWLRGWTSRAMAFSVCAVAGAVLASIFAMDSFHARLSEVEASSQMNEFDLRDILNQQSAAMLHDHPVVGIGWNNFGLANSRPLGAAYSEMLEEWDRSRGFTIYDENYGANPLTESLYWLILAETGWVGFVSFLLFAMATVWWAVRNAWAQRGTLMGAFSGALAVALVICYFHGMVERVLTQTKNLSEWLMLAGMAAGLEMNRRELLRARQDQGT